MPSVSTKNRKPAVWFAELILVVSIVAIGGFALASEAQLGWHEIVLAVFHVP